MKNLSIVLTILLLGLNVIGQDKKELKALSKKYNEFEQGSYKGATKVAVLGNNIRFRVASHQSETNSWKDEKSYKFGAYAVLEGIENEVFQEITDEYYKMLVLKFKELGIEVVPYQNIEATKSYAKLKEKYQSEPYNGTKGWGYAVIYNYDNHDFLAWNGGAPLGPHLKVAKELKTLLYNSQVTVDFCRIGVDIDQYRSSYPTRYTKGEIYTEGKASILPMVFVQHYTYNPQGTKMREDNTYSLTVDSKGKQSMLILDTHPSNISSDVPFAESSELCESCKPSFTKGKIKLFESNLGTVTITANPELYKKAVLDVLQQYLNETFSLYAAQRN